MKRFFTLLLLVSLFSCKSFSSEPKENNSLVDSTRVMLSQILTHTQLDFKQAEYPLLVHLFNKYRPDSLKVVPDKYKAKLNDYYYRRYYMYSKLIEERAVVTSDCLNENETGKWHPLKKLFFYGLYNGPTWEFPKDYVAMSAEYATEDTFYGPLNVLLNIYILKEYNWLNISNADRKAIQALENKMAEILYQRYVINREWGYFKVYALWAIRINRNPVSDKVDISPLAQYLDRQTWMIRFASDFENQALMKREGGAQTTYISNLCTYWLFYLLTT